MSIASEWRKKKGGFVVGPMSGSEADRISARVVEASPDGEADVGDAMKWVAEAVRGRRVTFRTWTFVSEAPPRGYRDSLDNLPSVEVRAGERGTPIVVMADGRTLIELDGGRSVVARIGGDCKLLGRWYRFVDWLLGRRIG